MDFKLTGKKALVTGAGSQIGMGKAIALTLAQEGCDVAVADMDLDGAQKTAAEIKKLGRKSVAIKVNITNSSEVNDMVKTAIKELGKIDILVNNAGAGKPPKPFPQYSDADFDFDLNVNLKGMLYCARAVADHMIANKYGKIVSIASGAGKVGRKGIASYSAAKAGVIIASESLAAELIGSGINVNTVAPGLSLTNFVKGTPQEFIEGLRKETPRGVFTTPQDIANTVVFLASDAAVNIVGQCISCTGRIV